MTSDKELRELIDDFRYHSELIGFYDAEKDIVALRNAVMIRERIQQRLLAAVFEKRP